VSAGHEKKVDCIVVRNLRVWLLQDFVVTQRTEQQAINQYSPVECETVHFGIYRVTVKSVHNVKWLVYRLYPLKVQ
jgi:hypothetical protein